MAKSKKLPGTVSYDATKDLWVGRVWIELPDGTRKRYRRKAKSELDAWAKIGQLVHGDRAALLKDTTTTVADLLGHWQEKALAARDLAPSTVSRHRWACELWVKHLGRVKLADVDPMRVERSLEQMATDGLAKASLVKVRATLRQALAWAEKRRVIDHNPAQHAELPAGLAPPREKRALSVDEARQLMKTLDAHPLGAMFALMLRCGLRPGEAAAVCVDALDLDTRTPTVDIIRAVQINRGRPVLVDDLKTKTSRRAVALPADVADLLRLHLTNIGNPDGGLLFTDTTRSGPPWATTVRGELRALCVEAGIVDVLPNELRHTAATLMVEAGLQLHEVADILGHADTRMLDMTYRHRPHVRRGADLVELG